MVYPMDAIYKPFSSDYFSHSEERTHPSRENNNVVSSEGLRGNSSNEKTGENNQSYYLSANSSHIATSNDPYFRTV